MFEDATVHGQGWNVRSHSSGKEGLEMCLKMLRFMAKGGMYDHIAQVISDSNAAMVSTISTYIRCCLWLRV